VVRVLIVAKTRMRGGVCIGALTRDENKNVRLIPPGRQNHPADTPFDVGQVWDLDFHQAPELSPPHIEDVIVTKQQKIAQLPNMREVLMQRVQPWQGGPHQLFDGLLTFGNSGKGYISKSKGVPRVSTGFWLSDKPLNQTYIADKLNYCYTHPSLGEFYIPFVGFATPVQELPAKSLVRVSLARWWSPPGINEERCYLQLSGWYL
jgi:ATP-dependent DNA helicase RecQ